MSILYVVVVQHINTADNLFLADTLRAVQADLADKRTISSELLADEVPPGTTDYFVRVLDRDTRQVIAEQPEMGDRLSLSLFPNPLSEDRVPSEGVEYRAPSGNWFLLMTASAVLDSNSPKPVLVQVAQDRSDDKKFTESFGKLLAAVLIGGIGCSAAIAFLGAKRALRPLEEMATATKKVQASQLYQRLGRGRWPNELTALAAAFAQKGEMDAARRSINDALALEPKLSFTWLKDHHYSNDPNYLRLAEATLYDGLRKAGLPE